MNATTTNNDAAAERTGKDKPACGYQHRRNVFDAVADWHPTLTPVKSRGGQTIALQCPVCLRTWPAGAGFAKPGTVGNALPRNTPADLALRNGKQGGLRA